MFVCTWTHPTGICTRSSAAHVLRSALATSAYNMGFNTMILDLNCTEFQATIGLSVFSVGFGVVPLVTASLSEEFGRQPLYIGSSIGFNLMFMMIALCVCRQTSCYRHSQSHRQVKKHPNRSTGSFSTRGLWIDRLYDGGRYYSRHMGPEGVRFFVLESSDIDSSSRRGLPMSIFALCAISGIGLGPLMAGWVEMDPRLGWRWIQWIQMM